MGKKDTKYVTYNNSKAQRTLHIFSITSMWWYSHRYDRAHSRPMCRWQRAEYEQCDSVKSQSHTFGRNYQLSAITLKICSSVVASNGSFRTFSFLLSLLIVEIFFFASLVWWLRLMSFRSPLLHMTKCEWKGRRQMIWAGMTSRRL